MKLHISELDLPNVRIQQRNLFLFQPWNTPRFHYINPFATYSKSTVAPVVFQRVFAYHRPSGGSPPLGDTNWAADQDPCGEGYVAEELRASSVTAPTTLCRNGPRGRGTWLRMARRRGLLHIEKSSLASALDRARQHVMGVSPVSFEESSGGYTGHVRKVSEFLIRGLAGAAMELEGIRVAKTKWRQQKE
ncbi:hypothetical protein TNCV_3196441 [Trichonephila clavipes]|nr:hypothetical protein TNCV_3196441 [Trichonephila clavipes]